MALLEDAVRLEPDSDLARVRLGILAHQMGDYKRQIEVLREAVNAGSTSVELINNYAYALATCPVEELRDGTTAVSAAEKAIELAAEPLPALMDTLAAAYAEAGQFDQAIKTMQSAIALMAPIRPHPRQSTATAASSSNIKVTDQFAIRRWQLGITRSQTCGLGS